MHNQQYMSAETVLYNTPPSFDTVQVILSQQGEVLRHWSKQSADSTVHFTQILWSVEDGNGHITVMVGEAIQLIQELDESSRHDYLQACYYGMESSPEGDDFDYECSLTLGSEQVEDYCRRVHLGPLTLTGSFRLMHDACTIYASLHAHNDNTVDIRMSTLLTPVSYTHLTLPTRDEG